MLEIPDYDPNEAVIDEVDARAGRRSRRVRHSASHVMAAAIKRLFPDAKLACGPAIEDGFYYDFRCRGRSRPRTSRGSRSEMAKIIAADQPFVKKMWTTRTRRSSSSARRGRPSRSRSSRTSEDRRTEVSSFENGDFLDLCRGPHVKSTRQIGAFKLLTSPAPTGAATRRTRSCSASTAPRARPQAELEEHLHRLEEAQKRDHRKLGRELDLFSVHEEVGGGLIFWHPKLGMVRHLIENFWREEHLRRGYELVYTPHIAQRAALRDLGPPARTTPT